MNDASAVLLAWLAGGLLGGMFFGGLWWTVRSAIRSPRAWLWFPCSGLFRTGLALEGFYLVSGGRWHRLIACLFGFGVARLIAVRLTAPARQPQARSTQEERHAP